MDTVNSTVILYLTKLPCEATDSLKSQMTDLMWQSTKIEYTSSDQPFLLTDDRGKITNTTEIIDYLQNLVFIQESSQPSTMEQLNNARIAATKALKELIETGIALAPNELVSHRRSICSTCPFKTQWLFMDKCSKCGCHIKSKTKLITEACPIDKW